MTAELVTPDLRAPCLEARDKLIELEAANMILRSDLDEARSKLILRDLMLRCLIDIADKHANQTGNDVYLRTVAFIKISLGQAPKREKPRLTVVGQS